MKLRDYQQKAVDGILTELVSNNCTLGVMPTGTGKTVVAAHVIDHYLKSGRVMVLAHREELLHQAAEKIEAVTGVRAEMEMASSWANNDENHFAGKSQVVVSTIQTQVSSRRGMPRFMRFDPMEFSFVWVDEAHHAAAETYIRVINHYRKNPNLKVLGVTATPDRHDEEALGKVFESVAFDYELPDAIRDGWLVEIDQKIVVVDSLNFDSCKTTAGDLNQGDLAELMEYEANLHSVAMPTIELAGDKKTLVFTVTVAQAERLTEIFNRYKQDSARIVTGLTPKDERREMLADYRAGKFQFLINVGVATEGFDVPDIEIVSIGRPTKSRALYSQMVGRGTRPLPGVVDPHPTAEERTTAIKCSSKPCVTILDFVGNSHRHKLITTADILGGNYDDAVVEKAIKVAREKGEPVNMAELLAKTEKDERLRKRHEEEQRRAFAVAQGAKYSATSINPFDVLDLREYREPAWFKGKMCTPKMIESLERFGVPKAKELTFNQGRQLLDRLFDKTKPTYKQINMLRKHGKYIDGMSRDDAKIQIDALMTKWGYKDRGAA